MISTKLNVSHKKSIWEAYERMYNNVHDANQHDYAYEKIGNVDNLVEKIININTFLRCTKY